MTLLNLNFHFTSSPCSPGSQHGLDRRKRLVGDRLGAGVPTMDTHPGMALLQDLVRSANTTPSAPIRAENSGNGRLSLGSKPRNEELAGPTERNVGELGEKEELKEEFTLPFSLNKELPHHSQRALIDILCGSSPGAGKGPEESLAQSEQFPPLPPSPEMTRHMFSPWLLEDQVSTTEVSGESEKEKKELDKDGGDFSSPLSPLRRLINPAVEFMKGLTGRKGLEKAPLPQKPNSQKPSGNRGVIKVPKGLKRRKALALARSSAAENLASLERGFCAESAHKAKASKVNTVVKLMVESRGSQKIWPLTVASLKSLAMALQGAGYKSGYAYLSEAKLLHVERGHDWDLALDRCYKQCVRSLKRGKGPTHQAPEVPKERRSRLVSSVLRFKTGVLFVRELFLFAMVWMLRAIELLELRLSDLDFCMGSKVVTLCWRTSKTDQTAEGVRRTVKCNCVGECDEECPYAVTEGLAQKLLGRFSTDSFLLVKKSGARAKVSEITTAWSKLFGLKVTGHSARRTGALNFIRSGWSIAQVAYLGRWKSNIILHYASEALQEVPINAQTLPSFSPFAQMESSKKEEEWRNYVDAAKEFATAAKADTEKVREQLQGELLVLKESVKDSHLLPPKVRSMYAGKAVHINELRSTHVPPMLWKTRCGWLFGGKTFSFGGDEWEVTCLKCIRAEQGGQ